MSFLRYRPLFYFDIFVLVHMRIHMWVNVPVWKPEAEPSGVPRSHSHHIPLRQSLSRHLALSWRPARPSFSYVYPPPSRGPGAHNPCGLLEFLGFELRASPLGSVLFSFPVAMTTHPDESDLREKGLSFIL